MEGVNELIEEWADQYSFVGYGIIEEVAFTHRAASAGNGNDPTIIEIESFLNQMNELNKRHADKRNKMLSGSSIVNRPTAKLENPIVENDDDESSEILSHRRLEVFTSSMTSSRQVRDHNRQLKYLLDALRLPHDVLDVSDNKFIQNQVVKLVREALRNHLGHGLPASSSELIPHLDDPPALLERCLPIVFFDQKIVGTYRDLQFLNDDKPNHKSLFDALTKVGFPVKPLT